VYTLEKVLRVKKDATTHIEFLEEVMKTLDEKPSFTFWTTLAKAFENQTKQAALCERRLSRPDSASTS
jgi:O-succinylbenzoate synthase